MEEAILIDAPAEGLARRLSDRWICSVDGGHVYTLTPTPPAAPGRCDVDGAPLIQRDDDRPETVRARLASQLGALATVVAYYEERGLLQRLDGSRSVDSVTDALLDAVRPGAGGRRG